jgi:hypothetical protein
MIEGVPCETCGELATAVARDMRETTTSHNWTTFETEALHYYCDDHNRPGKLIRSAVTQTTKRE